MERASEGASEGGEGRCVDAQSIAVCNVVCGIVCGMVCELIDLIMYMLVV